MQEPFAKMNSEWITALNVRYKTIKLLEGSTGEDLDDFWYGDGVVTFRYNTKGAIDKEIIANLDYIKCKTSALYVKRMRRSATDREKILALLMSYLLWALT